MWEEERKMAGLSEKAQALNSLPRMPIDRPGIRNTAHVSYRHAFHLLESINSKAVDHIFLVFLVVFVV